MSDIKFFTFGVVLLATDPLFDALHILHLMATSHPLMHGHPIHFLERIFFAVTPFIHYVAIAGFLILIAHHFRTAGSAEKQYRMLDRVLALFIAVVAASGVLGQIWLSISQNPISSGNFPYRGLALLVNMGEYLAGILCMFAWAHGLWHGRRGMALLGSAAYLMVALMPSPPVNNPDFFVSQPPSQGHLSESVLTDDKVPLQGGPETLQEFDESDTVPPKQDVMVVSETKTSVKVSLRYLAGIFLFYTWMRWGGRVKHRSTALPEPVPEAPETPIPRAYLRGEFVLLLLLPTAFAGAVILSLVQQRLPLLTYNFSAAMEFGLVVLVAWAFFVVYRHLPDLGPTQLRGLERVLGVLLWLFLLPLVLQCIGPVWTIATLHSNPYLYNTVGYGEMMHKLLHALIQLTGVWFWRRGVRKNLPIHALCGAALFAALFSPIWLARELYPAAFGSSDFPMGSDTAQMIFWPGYFRFHLTTLVLLTFMLLGPVSSPENEQQIPNPA